MRSVRTRMLYSLSYGEIVDTPSGLEPVSIGLQPIVIPLDQGVYVTDRAGRLPFDGR